MTHEPLRLRPMGVGDLLDTAFRLYRRHFLLFVGIVGVIYVPLTLVRTVLEGAFLFTEAELVSMSSIGFYFITQLALLVMTFIAVQGLMNGAMARAVADSYLGRPRGLVDTFRALGWRWLRLVGALIVLGLLDFGIFLLFLIPCVGWIAGLIILIYVNVPISSFLAPVVVVEGQGAVGSLGRAFDLGRGQFYRLLELLYGVQTTPVEPDYGRAVRYLATRHKKRSLVLLFTDLGGALGVASLTRHVQTLRPRHLPLVVTISDPATHAVARARPVDSMTVYQRAIAEKLLEERRVNLERLSRQGVLTLDVPAEKLTVAVINKYLEFKARTLL